MNKFLPKKYLGQNFLVNEKVIEKIIEAAEIRKIDNILEVGPGMGALTFKMAKKAKRVLAVEKDRRLVDSLHQNAKTQNFASLRLIESDILRLSFDKIRDEFAGEPYRIVANLPYQITSFFLRKFLASDYAPSEMVIMVQKEVGERIVAKPGKMSLLSVSVQFFAAPEILFHVGRGNFSPAPKVDSVVLRLKDIRRDKYGIEPEKFFALLKKGFRFKRKLLKNNLELPAGFFKNAGFREDIRAEQLSMEDWMKIYAMVHAR